MQSRGLSLGFAAAIALAISVAQSSGQVVTELYSFTGDPSSTPTYAVPSQGRDGRLYGTTSGQRRDTLGSVFRIATSGIEQDIYALGAVGSGPNGGLTLASNGNFYGTAPSGGSFGFGVLYSITPGGVYSVLHEFTGGDDGDYPFAASD